MADSSLRVKLLRESARAPARATDGSTGLDLYACTDDGAYIELGPDVTRVPTGIALEAPPGYDVQIRPRSSLGLRGVNVILGTVDADYRGEIFVAMHTFGSCDSYRIEHGDRIAQLVISRLSLLPVEIVEDLADSQRGSGGYGSTGR